MSITFSSSVSCSEMEGTIESVTDAGLTAKVKLRCAWADRYTLFESLIYSEWPYKPGCGAFAWTGTIRGLGSLSKSTQGVAYENAVVEVDYIQPEWAEINSTDIVSEAIEPSAEFVTMDHSDFRWGSGTGDPIKSEEAPGKLSIGFDYVQTRYRLASIPLTTLTEIGKVNQAAQTASYLSLTFPAETLLFVSSSPTRAIGTFTIPKWDLTSRYSYKPNGWNKFWRAKTNTYEQMYLAGESTPTKPYPTSTTIPLI